jgi:hypothetical protein
MAFIAGAIIGGGLLGAAGSILGADRQADGARDAAQLQMEQFRILNQQQQPFIQGGYGANTRLLELLGIAPPGSSSPLSFEEWSRQNPAERRDGAEGFRDSLLPQEVEARQRGLYNQYVGGFKPTDPSQSEGFGSLLRPFDAETFAQYQDPGYLFRKRQGEQSVLNSASAGSGALSGAALKDLMGFNQDLASTEYGNAFNRYQTQQGNIFQRLSGIANLGQSAAAGVGQQGTALATGAGQSLTNAGTAAGAGIVGATNALGGAASNYWLSNMLRPVSGGGP